MPWPSFSRTTSSPAEGLLVVEFLIVPVRVWAEANAAAIRRKKKIFITEVTGGYTEECRVPLSVCFNFTILLSWVQMRLALPGARFRRGEWRVCPPSSAFRGERR